MITKFQHLVSDTISYLEANRIERRPGDRKAGLRDAWSAGAPASKFLSGCGKFEGCVGADFTEEDCRRIAEGWLEAMLGSDWRSWFKRCRVEHRRHSEATKEVDHGD